MGTHRKDSSSRFRKRLAPVRSKKKRLLAEVGNGHGAAGLGHLARNAFPHLVGNFEAFQVDAMSDLQPRFAAVAIEQRYHAPLHTQAYFHLIENLLKLISQIPRLGQGLGNGVQGR